MKQFLSGAALLRHSKIGAYLYLIKGHTENN
jgi:hypothetical protein